MTNTMSRTLARTVFRSVDGPDMWGLRTRRNAPKPPVTGVVNAWGPDSDAVRMREVIRMHTSPHLYSIDDDGDPVFLHARDAEVYRLRQSDADTWALDIAREHMADSTGLWDWDCDGCRTAVMTPEITDPCPRCGAL